MNWKINLICSYSFIIHNSKLILLFVCYFQHQVNLFKNFSQKIAELREENKRLVTEREHLRKILSDREDDIKLIRKQWIKEKKQHPEPNEKQNIIDEDIVKRLEALQIKYECLKRDLQSLLDEKVDLIQERDAYKCKVHRLNHSMAALLKSG